jgi:hypothetical protein
MAKWMGTSDITVTCTTTGRAGASANYTLNLNSPQPGDKVTLWIRTGPLSAPRFLPRTPRRRISGLAAGPRRQKPSGLMAATLTPSRRITRDQHPSSCRLKLRSHEVRDRRPV